MTRSVWTAFALVIVTAAPSYAAGPARCQDIPLRVTMYSYAVVDPATQTTTPTALRADGLGEYVNGLSSVSAVIKGCTGTNDAVLNLTSSKRSFTYTFPVPIAGSVIDAAPNWVPGTYAASGWINIRNLTFSKDPFATQAGSTFTTSAEGSTFRLGFKGTSPDFPNAPNLDDPSHTAGDNVPMPSSPVMVYPAYPALCGTGSMPAWLVRGTSPNSPETTIAVATLHKQSSKPGGADTHQGQYSLPFEMRIEAMKCFAY